MSSKQSSIQDKIKHARPKLKLVAPLTYRICQGLAGVSTVISIYFFFITTNFKNAPLAITQGFLGFSAWGFLYLMIALAISYGLYKNDWKLLRTTLGVSLTIQTMWTLAIMLLVATGYSVFGIMILWLFLTWTQAWTIVHFLPVVNWDGTGGDGDDKR